MGDYVGHSFVIGIVATYDRKNFLPTLKTLYQKHHDSPMLLHLLCKKKCNTNVIFGVGVSKDETCFKQVSVVSHTSLILIYKTL
jgi:hypothetical protein